MSSGGCTDCGRKGGCDSRKGSMFEAIDEALGRLYPSRRWSDRDEGAAFGAGLDAGEGAALAEALATRLRAATLYRPGTLEETCDYVYVLCVGRPPSLLEWREGMLDSQAAQALRATLHDGGGGGIDEVYLRVALSTLGRFAAVQEVDVRARLEPRLDHVDGGDADLLLSESPRSGIFSPPLLRRLQGLVGVLAERRIRHLDFGEIVEAPAGFDPGDYPERWGGVPGIANYLFYPQPPSTVVVTTVT